MKTHNIVLALLAMATGAQANYPFTNLPPTITATFSVNTKVSETANNKLLGYNIFNYTKAADQDFIRKCDPITIRFPNGVWANFYDWETDSFTKYGDAFKPSKSWDLVLNEWARKKVTGGFPGLAELNREKKKQNGGAGYDVLWTYNIDYDDAQKSAARLRDSEKNGFDVQAIELGNEWFWKSQRSGRVDTPEKYVQVARATSKALKAIKPELQVSIPLSWRGEHADFNRVLAADMSYYDAISLHKYIGGEKAAASDVSYAAILTARLSLAESIDYVRKFGPEKKVWLSEWGVSTGKEKTAAAALGMADCYLYLFENQKICDRANWFSVNGSVNSFFTHSDKRGLKYPLEKTGFGAVYGIIRDFFANATLLAGEMVTAKLTTDKGSVAAVSARAAIKNGRFCVIALNLTDRTADFTIRRDGGKYIQPLNHQAMVFKELNEVRVTPFGDNPLITVQPKSGEIKLPPFSINIISEDHAL